MRTCFKIIIITLIIMHTVGCALTQEIGGTSLPEPSQNFAPQTILSSNATDVFDATVSVLDEKRVIIQNQDRSAGRLTTDYITGSTQMTALGLLGTNSTRFRYLIMIKPAEGGARLTVTAFLESSGNAVQSWRDVSADNKEIVRNLEYALIEDIEGRLK
jgi:hypothetical protein